MFRGIIGQIDNDGSRIKREIQFELTNPLSNLFIIVFQHYLLLDQVNWGLVLMYELDELILSIVSKS